MNSFQRNLQDSATSEAKRTNSSAVDAIHILAAVALLLKSPALEGLRARARTLVQSGDLTGLTSDAEEMLNNTLDESAARTLLANYLASQGDSDGAAAVQSDQSEVEVPNSNTRVTEDETQTLEEVMAELNSLIGLDAVKEQVRKLLAMQQANQVRDAAGKPKIPLSLHLVFTGEPGTGKTTVARIVGKLYRASGLLPRGHLVETDRAGLVAGFVGQTALKVADVLKEAEGGVLFIDEAYALAGGAQDFGPEAIAALVKGMEDRRESLAIIAAGYHEQMGAFIEANPGLRSRFQTFIEFPSYSPAEMTQIFEKLAREHAIEAQAVMSAVQGHLEAVPTGGDHGNGRYVRALFERMYANLALRAAQDGQVQIHEVSAFSIEDVPTQIVKDAKSRIGFVQGS